MVNSITIMDEEGDEMELPARWSLCSACDGNGKSSAYLGAYTSSEMAEAGPDFHDEYMNGAYDKTCDCCKGAGKVLVADFDRMTKAQRKAFEDAQGADADMREMERAERAFGC